MSQPSTHSAPSMALTVDGQPVMAQQGETVMACALRHGISIPHLCTHPQLPAFGACRICVVQIDGLRGFPTSCTTPAAEGMVVRTNTPELADLRRRILELMMLEHPSACLVCDKRELCEKYRPKADKAGRTTGCHTCNNKEVCHVRTLSEQLHLCRLPVPPRYHNTELERSDPFIDRDLNLCILCGRCVRICKVHHGWSTIDFVGRGSQTRIGEAFGRSLTEAGCRFCGSCIDVCPTGSLVERYAKWQGAASSSTDTTCAFCDAACAIRVASSSRRRPISARAVDSRFPICVLGRFAMPEFLAGPSRLIAPQMRVGQVLRQVPWKQLLEQAADRLRTYSGEAFALVCDTSITLEDRHVLARFTRDVMGSPHYIEAATDDRGRAQATLPDGVKAALFTGAFVPADALTDLELLLVQDCYPSAVSERADFILPAAVLAEVGGTIVDSEQQHRPLRQACTPPGKAQPDWQIATELAQALGPDSFAYSSVQDIAAQMGLSGAQLRLDRDTAPRPALEPSQRRTHFRGHCIADHAKALAQIPLDDMTESVASTDGGG